LPNDFWVPPRNILEKGRTMTLTKLASNMVIRMVEIDAFADPDAYSHLWDAILDEFKAAGVDLAPMICAAWTKGNNP
jgi:hypothetical protein